MSMEAMREGCGWLEVDFICGFLVRVIENSKF